MTETASLIIKVDSRGAESASRDLDKLTGASGRAEGKVGLLTGAYKAFAAVAASAALAQTVGMYVRLADESANMSARLRLATKSQDEFNVAQRATFEIAQRTSGELGSVVDLYAKLSQATGELGLTQGQVLQMTETITQAFTVSGASAQEAAGGLRQLGQAMAGGTLRAEEFNSIIDSSPRIVQALADHFGVSFGKVRTLVNDGKISSEQFAQAMLAASEKVQAEFDQMPLTVGRATQQVRNSLLNLVGEVDSAEGASAGLAETIERLARLLESDETRQAFEVVIGLVAATGGAFVTLTGQIAGAISKYNEWLQSKGFAKADQIGTAEGLDERIRGLSNIVHGDDPVNTVRMAMFGDTFREQLRLAVAERSQMQDRTQGLPADWGLNAGAGIGRKPTASGGGGGGATASIDSAADARRRQKEADRAWADQMAEIEAHESVAEAARMDRTNERLRKLADEDDARERQRQATAGFIDDLQFEMSLLGLSNIEREKAIALRYANVDAASEEGKAIGELVDRLERGREAESDMLLLRDGAKDLFGTIVTDSARASDALNRFFDNLKARAADKLFEGLMSGFAGMAGGGGWAGFAQGFGKGWTGGGKAAGGPLQAGQGYLVGDGGGPELFVPGQSGRLHPIGGAAGGGALQVVINNNGTNKVSAREETVRGSGGMDIRKLIVDIVADDMASGGKSAAAMKGRFNLREAF